MKKRGKVFLACVAVVVALFFAGCASMEVLVNPDATFPLEITDTAPAFVFPISLHIGGGADVDALGLGISGAVVAEFGGTVIPGQQLYDLVGNLSWSLGETLRKKANSGEWVMDGYAETVATDLANMMEAILGMLKELGLIDPSYAFKYLVVLHADSSGSAIPGTRSFVAFGGIYEVETKKILAYTETEVSVADVPETMLAQVPLAFLDIIKGLLAGGPPA